jgi:hypothetical protein
MGELDNLETLEQSDFIFLFSCLTDGCELLVHQSMGH